MSKKIVPRIMMQYGISVDEVSSVQKGYRNECYRVLWGGGEANLIIYKNEVNIDQTILRANNLSAFAHLKGLPVRFPVDKRITVINTKQQRRFASLYNYLPGHTIPWEAYSKKHIKLLGQALSDLHYSWRNRDDNLSDITSLLLSQFYSMKKYFNEPGVTQALRSKLALLLVEESFESLEKHLKISEKLTPIQPLHMDFVRGNVLFKEGQISLISKYSLGKVELTGILDFEKVARGHIVFDIARSFAFLLVDCAHYSEEKLRKYFLASGYKKRGQQGISYPIIRHGAHRTHLFEELTTYYLLYDFFKLLRHNPYEALKENHHYIRTRDLLIKRGMIQLT